jgi:high-affinity nickel permease
MDWILPCGTALLLGSVHAFEADHMVAVTAFAVRRRRPLDAVSYGLRWAAGHGTAVVTVGAILLIVALKAPDALTHGLERGVGAVLIGLGLWTVLGARSLHAHQHAHDDGTRHMHMHSHAFNGGHRHGHGATLVGLLHGLAGTAPALALIPIAGAHSVSGGIAYLLFFAIGTAAGMALYAFVAGLIVDRAAVRSQRFVRILARTAGLATIMVGAVWLLR